MNEAILTKREAALEDLLKGDKAETVQAALDRARAHRTEDEQQLAGGTWGGRDVGFALVTGSESLGTGDTSDYIAVVTDGTRNAAVNVSIPDTQRAINNDRLEDYILSMLKHRVTTPPTHSNRYALFVGTKEDPIPL